MDFRFPDFVRTDDHPEGHRRTDSPRLVFHHLPKTAGSTFRRMLESLFPPENVCPHEIDDEIKALPEEQRRAYRMFAGHFSFDLLHRHFRNDIRIVFLRDPVERIVSNYYNLRDPARYQPQWIERASQSPEVQSNLELIQGLSFSEFIRHESGPIRDRVCNFQTRRLLRNGQKKRFSDERFPDYSKPMLKAAKRSLARNFQFVGLQSHFGLSLQLFAMTFGLDGFHGQDDYSTNINPLAAGRMRQSYRDALDAADLEYLEARNRMDTKLVTFGRELLLQRVEHFLPYCIQNELLLRLNREAAASGTAGDAPVRTPVERVPRHRGLHRLERDGHGRHFRWTGYESPCALWLEADVGEARRVTVELEYLNAMGDDVLSSVALRLDGVESMTTAVEKGIIRATFERSRRDPARLAHVLHITSRVEREPSDVPHPRDLGIAVHAVTLRTGA